MRSILLDVAQLVAHLVRDQEVAGSSPVIQTIRNQALTETQVLDSFMLVALLSHFQHVINVKFQCVGKDERFLFHLKIWSDRLLKICLLHFAFINLQKEKLKKKKDEKKKDEKKKKS